MEVNGILNITQSTQPLSIKQIYGFAAVSIKMGSWRKNVSGVSRIPIGRDAGTYSQIHIDSPLPFSGQR